MDEVHEMNIGQADEQDQAASLKEHIEGNEEEMHPEYKVDILNLPPRQEVHQNDSKKVSYKLSRPLFRLISVLLLILLLVGVAFYFDFM